MRRSIAHEYLGPLPTRPRAPEHLADRLPDRTTAPQTTDNSAQVGRAPNMLPSALMACQCSADAAIIGSYVQSTDQFRWRSPTHLKGPNYVGMSRRGAPVRNRRLPGRARSGGVPSPRPSTNHLKPRPFESGLARQHTQGRSASRDALSRQEFTSSPVLAEGVSRDGSCQAEDRVGEGWMFWLRRKTLSGS